MPPKEVQHLCSELLAIYYAIKYFDIFLNEGLIKYFNFSLVYNINNFSYIYNTKRSLNSVELL